MEPNKDAKPPKSKGYGKRPIWQWALIYIVIAAVVYYAAYLLFFHHGGSAGTSMYHY